MKILSVIESEKDFIKLKALSDGFIIRYDRLNYKSRNRLSIEKIWQLSENIQASEKEVFLDCTLLSTNNELEIFVAILKKFIKINGIIVSDIGFINIALKEKLAHLLIYNPETLLTNHHDFNFFADYKLYGAFLAKELSLEEAIEILALKKYKSFIIGFGHLNMFYSRRKILSNYLKSEKKKKYALNDFHFQLREELRPDFLPLLETIHGSAIFRAKPLSLLAELKQLQTLDYLVLDNVFINRASYYQVVSTFKAVLSGSIKELPVETDSGLLYNKSLIQKEPKQ
ncbi:MAG: U32 family peptidase [Erysipelotrichales bacterium]|nr:U32 family peptidase [Erysipelotrichales bacterium]